MSALVSRMEHSTIVEGQRIRTNEQKNETDMYMIMHMFNF